MHRTKKTIVAANIAAMATPSRSHNATEAALAVRALVPGRAISLIRVENEASKNVARKVGMTPEREIEVAGFQTEVFASPSP